MKDSSSGQSGSFQSISLSARVFSPEFIHAFGISALANSKTNGTSFGYKAEVEDNDFLLSNVYGDLLYVIAIWA